MSNNIDTNHDNFNMTYKPNLVDTSTVKIPSNLESLIEQLSEQVHESWAATRIAQGWSYGPSRNDATLQHPGLVPYSELTESEKDVDRATVISTIKLMLHFGYEIDQNDGE